MIDRFAELLRELSSLINVPLYISKQRTCGLKVNHILPMQLKMDDLQEKLLISTFISELPAGRFREDVFKEALKANHHYPRLGVLAYTAKTNQLVAFEYLSLTDLNGEKLALFLNEFISFANQWRTSIEKGELRMLNAPSSTKGLPPPFGMRP